MHNRSEDTPTARQGIVSKAYIVEVIRPRRSSENRE